MSSENTKKKIRKKLLEIMRGKEIRDIKTKEITDALGISRTTFYLYYDSTYAVLQEIEDEYFDVNIQTFSQYLACPCNDIYFNSPHPAALIAVKMMRENAELHKSLWGQYGDPVFQHRCENLVEDFITKRAIKEKYISIDEKYRDLVSAYIIGAQRAVFRYFTKKDLKGTDEEYAIFLYRLLFSPFRVNYEKFK
jgi:AcrR family transcriptional regulator